ncbi:MAG: cytochrome c maturation protein CcmE [Caulobacterales bacterium]|nr:cytochrome c maturation protein CcmE [Caulobacterales bacterium]
MRGPTRRLRIIAIAAAALSVSAVLVALALRDAAAFFQTPSEFAAEPPPPGRSVRVGGLVEVGSLRAVGEALTFRLIDDVGSMEVAYAGPVPNLFREGQCVIAEGEPDGFGGLRARRLLAKHDENYRPPEIDAAPRLAESCGVSEAGA